MSFLGKFRHSFQHVGQRAVGVEHGRQHLERGDGAVAGGGAVEAEGVPGRFTTQHAAMGFQHFHDIPVADRRPEERRPGARDGLLDP